MKKVTLYDKNEISLANEVARVPHIVENAPSFTVEGSVASFDAEDAGDLALVFGQAERYWLSVKKRAMARAAERLARVCRDVVANERYLRTFES